MSWKRIIGVLFTAAVAFGTGAAPAHAQSSTATVNYEVQAITLLTLSGSATVTITTGTAGTGLTDVTDSAGVTYAITNNAGADSKKLVGSLDTSMPANTTLSAAVTAPTGGASAGFVALTTSDQDLVTGIDNVAESSIGVSFKLHATVAAGIVASDSKTFTMTVLAN